MNEMEVTRIQKQQREVRWHVGAPLVCHRCVRYDQSCGRFCDLLSLNNFATCITPRGTLLLQRRSFCVNNGRLCDATTITACICFSCITGEVNLRLGCWQHLFPFVESVTTCYSISQIYRKLHISLLSALFA
jgi:hypothetical protein